MASEEEKAATGGQYVPVDDAYSIRAHGIAMRKARQRMRENVLIDPDYAEALKAGIQGMKVNKGQQDLLLRGKWNKEAQVELRVERVNNGFIVRAGCMVFVFDDAAKLGAELTRWAHNPEQVEKEYSKKYSPRPAFVDGLAERDMDQAEVSADPMRIPLRTKL